jgi:hypothetical protein
MKDSKPEPADEDGRRRRRAAIALVFGIPFLLAMLYMTGTVETVPLECLRVWARQAGFSPEADRTYALLQTISFFLAFLSIFIVVLMTFIVALARTEGHGIRAGVMTASIFGIVGGHIMLSPPPVYETWMFQPRYQGTWSPAPAPEAAPQPPPPPPAATGAGV